MNSTAGPNGLVPTLFVFGVLPRIPLAPSNLLEQRDRMKALHTARLEMNTYITKERVNRALRNNVPKSHESEVKFCMSVLVFKEKPINKSVSYTHLTLPTICSV